ELGDAHVLALPPDEQYLVATGRTYFRGLAFDDLRRMQFDLETTGLDAARDRIFLVAVRDPAGGGRVGAIEARGEGDAPGRGLIATRDAGIRYDFSARELPGHGLKAVARHFGLAGPERELIRGDRIHATYRTDPARVRRYAIADVEEVAALGRVLGGAA